MTDQATDLVDPADEKDAVDVSEIKDGPVDDSTDEVSDDDLETLGSEPQIGPDYAATQAPDYKDVKPS